MTCLSTIFSFNVEMPAVNLIFNAVVLEQEDTNHGSHTRETDVQTRNDIMHAQDFFHSFAQKVGIKFPKSPRNFFFSTERLGIFRSFGL